MLRDLEAHLAEHNPVVYNHMMGDQGFTMEATFSAQIITAFLYDLDFDLAMRIFDLFLLEGEQAIVDLLIGTIELKTEKILTLKEIHLMNYLRKDLIKECFAENTITGLLPNTRVSLHYLKEFKKI